MGLKRRKLRRSVTKCHLYGVTAGYHVPVPYRMIHRRIVVEFVEILTIVIEPLRSQQAAQDAPDEDQALPPAPGALLPDPHLAVAGHRHHETSPS